jgi:hypothetical protein
MSRPTHRWSSNIRSGSDDDDYDYAGSSSREWRTRQPWEPQHQSPPQQRNAPATSSWHGTERQQRWWHKDEVSALQQSGVRQFQQQQLLRSAEASSASASVLPWRTRNEFAEQQQKSPRSSWHTRERDDRGSRSGQEPFVEYRRAWPNRAWPDTQEQMATERARQERMQIHRGPRDWDDTRLSPRPTHHTDEQLPDRKLLCRGTNAVNQLQTWRQAGAQNTSHDSASQEIDFQRDCHHEYRSVAEFVQERERVQIIDRRATFSGPATFTSSTRLIVTDNPVAARPWARKLDARHQPEYNERADSSSGSRNGVVVDATPTQAKQENDCDPSSDYEDSDALSDDGDRVLLGQIDDRDSRERYRLVLGKRKAADASPRNDFDRCGLIGVAVSAKPKVKQDVKVCKVEDCTSLVRSRGVCIAHGGGKRCQYREGCDKSDQGATSFCRAHGGGKRCQYPDGCGKGAEGRTMFCIAHGGGKRCQYPDGCDKGAEGRTWFCVAHGGGKRCQYPEGCGKSAKGATPFCQAHGGGKRCQYPDGCDKGAEGRTLFCKAHGGGKRCQYPEGCDKSAIGRTMFCKAHGGGKRCIHNSGCNRHVVKRGMCKKHGVASGLWT